MNIDLIPNGAIKRVHVSQNDIGRTLTFNLFNDSLAYTIPNGATVKIQGTKPSGFGFSETCTVSGNTVTIDTTEAMTDEFGYIEAELQITNSGDVLGTSNFILAVEKNPHPSNTTDGTQITAQSLEVRIEALEESALGGLTDEAKQALLNCLSHVAWIDDDGQAYYDVLERALYPPANLSSISCVYTQSGAVYDTDSLNSLKSDLVVTAHYDDDTSETVTTYTLSGALTAGTSTITVSYETKTTTFNVTVTQDPTQVETILATLIPGTDFTYVAGTIAVDTGIVTENASSNYRVSELISIPTGTTSFSYGFSKWDSNSAVIWYDDEEAFAGNGYGGGTYSSSGTYGDGYTDANQDIWHAVPATAKYMRISWRQSDNTLSKVMFKQNVKLDENVTPVVGRVYYYTYTGSSTSANSDDYLPCQNMSYAHARYIYRRGYTLYDSEKIAVSTHAVANNIGNNVAIPSTASYIKFGNTTSTSSSKTSSPTRNGIGLIMFSSETLSSW